MLLVPMEVEDRNGSCCPPSIIEAIPGTSLDAEGESTAISRAAVSLE